MRRGRSDDTNMDDDLAKLNGMDIHTIDQTDWPLTIGLARNHRLTVYDASYLALAVSCGTKLVSLDRELVHAARSEGVTLLA